MTIRIDDASTVEPVMVNPLGLGAGRTIFQGVSKRLGLKLTQSRTFKSGKVFLSYVSG
jgi:hypothetical protein